MRYVLIVAVLAGLLLAGCGPGEDIVSSATSRGAQPGDSTTEPSPTPAAARLVIEYRRSGGFRGVNEAWFIYSDGRVVAQGVGEKGTEKEFRVEAVQVADLLRQIEAAGFFSLQSSYRARGACCDRFTYELTVHGEGRSKTVTAIEAAPEAPPALWDIIEQIQRLVDKAAGS